MATNTRCVYAQWADCPYERVETIGSGGAGFVCAVKSTSEGQSYAMKVISLSNTADASAVSETRLRAVLNEVRIMGTLEHIHTMRLVDTFQVRSDFAIVMERAYMDLHDFLEVHSEPDHTVQESIARWLGCLLTAVAELHRHGIQHQDIKPQNILIDQSATRVFLADFGISRMGSGAPTLLTTDHGAPQPGTPEYAAPEADHSQGRSADVFSLGAVLLEMLTFWTEPSQLQVLWNALEPDSQRGGGAPGRSYARSLDAAHRWIDGLGRRVNLPAWYHTVLFICRAMMNLDRHQRPRADDLLAWCSQRPPEAMLPGECACRKEFKEFDWYGTLEADDGLRAAYERGHRLMVTMFQEKGGNIDGDEILLAASKGGMMDVVEPLVTEKADSKIKDRAFVGACANGCSDIAKLLLDRGVDGKNHRALLAASGGGFKDLVVMLLGREAGADTTDCLLAATTGGFEDVVKELLKSKAHGDLGSCLLEASSRGFVGIAQAVLDDGTSIETADGQRRTALHVAAANGHLDVVQMLARRNCDIDALDDKGRSPVMLAIMSQSAEVANFFLSPGANSSSQLQDEPQEVEGHSGGTELHEMITNNVRGPLLNRLKNLADLEARNDRGQTPLSLAASLGNVVIAWALLERGANIEAVDENYRTPLLWAAEAGHGDVVSVLLQRRPRIDAKDAEGRTPLSLAAQGGHHAVVELLLQGPISPASSGAAKSKPPEIKFTPAQVESRDDGPGRTPLAWAASENHAQAVQALLDGGAEIDAVDDEGRTALSLASEAGHEAVVRTLVEKNGADIAATDDDIRSPLSYAAEHGRVGVVKLLLAQDEGSGEEGDCEGRSPLWQASANGHVEVGRLLMKKGADLEARDDDGRTPLATAARNGHVDVVKALLKNGADLDAEDEKQQTPLALACKKGHAAVVRVLLKQRKKIKANLRDYHGRTPLCWAAMGGFSEIVNQLLLEVKIESMDDGGRTALSYAAENGHSDVVQMLVDLGDDDKFDRKDIKGWTPLFYAAGFGRAKVVEILLETASVNGGMVDGSGMTPLWHAAANGHAEVVRILLASEAGGGSLGGNSSGSPFLSAAMMGHVEVIQVLMTRNVDLDQRFSEDRTPLSHAAERGHADVVQLFLGQGEIKADFADTWKRTPLWHAAAKGRARVVELLLESGRVRPDAPEYSGRTPLSMAASMGSDSPYSPKAVALTDEERAGYSAVMNLLVGANGVDPNSEDNPKRPPLYWAAVAGHAAGLKILVESGRVDPALRMETHDGSQTAIQEAIFMNHVEAVQVLVESGKIDVDEDEILHDAAGGKPEIVGLLLQAGAQPDKKDAKHGRTPLSWASARGSVEVVKRLLGIPQVDADSKADGATSSGRTPLSFGAESGSAEVVRLLLKAGKIDVNSKATYDADRGRTALSFAAAKGHVDVVKILLGTNEVAVNSQAMSDADRGQTALSFAAANGRTDVVKALLAMEQIDADTKATSKAHRGRTALSFAAANGHLEIAKALIENEEADIDANCEDWIGRTPLSWAAENGHLDMVKLLLDSDGVYADQEDSQGWSPVLHALVHGHKDVVALLESEAISYVGPDSSGETASDDVPGGGDAPGDDGSSSTSSRNSSISISSASSTASRRWRNLLYSALTEDSATVVERLTSSNVNVAFEDRLGRTLLSYAASNGRTKLVGVLLENQAVDPDLADKGGRTPLSWAAAYGPLQVVEMLLDTKRVNINSKDSVGRTPLSYAAEIGRLEVAKLLCKRGDDKAMAMESDNNHLPPYVWASLKSHTDVYEELTRFMRSG